MRTKLVSLAAAAALTCVLCPAASAADATLDYEFFKTRVEPIFLTKRPDHVRCYVCHSESNNAFKLEKLSAGLTAENHALAVEIATIPDEIRGYGHVKERAVEVAEKKLAMLMAKWDAGPAPRMQAAE